MRKPTEIDANEFLDSRMSEHYQAHMMKVLGRTSVGCDSTCADTGECTCSHASAPRRPRQPRRPEPRTPHLPLWTRLKLVDWPHWIMVGVLLPLSLVGLIVSVSELVAMAATLAVK